MYQRSSRKRRQAVAQREFNVTIKFGGHSYQLSIEGIANVTGAKALLILGQSKACIVEIGDYQPVPGPVTMAVVVNKPKIVEEIEFCDGYKLPTGVRETSFLI